MIPHADEIARYTTGVLMARVEYAANPTTPECSTGLCSSQATCMTCRRRLKADLIVATSEAECAEILERLDRPAPGRPSVQCGTESGYVTHRRKGEAACDACRAARAAYSRDRYRKASRP